MYGFALYYILLYDFNKLSKNYDSSKALNLGTAYLHVEKHFSSDGCISALTRVNN